MKKLYTYYNGLIFMAKLKEIKNLNNLLNNHLTELDGILQMQIKKIKNEYINNLIAVCKTSHSTHDTKHVKISSINSNTSLGSRPLRRWCWQVSDVGHVKL